MINYRLCISSLTVFIIIRNVLCETSPSNFICAAKDNLNTFNYSSLSEGDLSIVGEQENEKIALRLCSPLSQRCAGRSGYAVCLHKDGNEIGIGKFPPRLNNDTTAMQFVFTGDPCGENKTENYTVQVLMKCNYSASGISKPVTLARSADLCTTHMIWQTDKACVEEPAKTNCTVVDELKNVYDLSPLTATSDNHFVHIDNKSTSKLIINVCHSIIYEHGATCSPKVAACFKNSSDPNQPEYLDYGVVDRPLFIDNGTLKIVYDNGIICPDKDSDLQNYQTTISFICDPEATGYTEPRIMKISRLCDWQLLWKTVFACNETFLNHYREVKASNWCTVTNPNTKFKYNLQELTKKKIIANTTSGSQYEFQICGQLSESKCTGGTGNCKTEDSTSAGTANSNLMWRSGGPYLNYTDGATCGNNQKRYTLIAFVCGAEGSPNISVVVKDDPCYVIIHRYTDLVCENRTACATAKNESSLIPLIRTTKNYEVKAEGKVFYINVCRPVVPTPNLACPHGSSACQAVKNSEHQYSGEISLGFPDEDPIQLDNDDVILNYKQGSPCTENPEKNISSSLRFLCDYNGSIGIPEYKNYSNCHYVFEWKTNIVCSAVVGNMVPPCTIKDPSHSYEVDLTLLDSKTAPRLVTHNGKNYSISICGEKKHCNGSAVCQGTNGYGIFSTVTFDYKHSTIRMQYLNGSKCSNNSYASEFSLICNRTAGIGEPMLTMDANCSFLFDWQTNVTCPVGDGRNINVPSSLNTTTTTTTTTDKTLTDSPPEMETATQTWVIATMLFLVILVIGIWLYMRNPQRCAHLRSRISAITAARNHSRVQYSRVNTTEEAHLLLDTSDSRTDGRIETDDELLNI